MIAFAIAMVVAFGSGSIAQAQPSKASVAATSEFDKGRALMKSKQYADACAAFERSNQLEPLPGTLYNLAACYVQIGKLATAWASFRDLAGRDPNQARRKAANREAMALAKRLPKLVVKAAKSPGLVVTVDGVDITSLVGTDTPIDLGSHAIEAKGAAGTFTKTIEITDEGKTTTVEIALVPASTRQPDPPITEPSGPVSGGAGAIKIDRPARSTRKRNAVIVGGFGAAALAGGLAFTFLASGKWDEARQLCGEDLMCDSDSQLEEGSALVDAARLRAHVSTGLLVGGAVLVSTAIYLYISKPADRDRTAVRLAPSAGPGHVGLTIGGGF